MFSPLVITNENANELSINANQMSKKLKIAHYYGLFMFPQKKVSKRGRKLYIMRPVRVGPLGRI